MTDPTTFATLLNSSWASAIIGGALGAFGGAVGAQMITERLTKARNYQREIKQTNKSIAITLQILNTACSFKKQFVIPITEKYKQQKRDINYSKKIIQSPDEQYACIDFTQIVIQDLPLANLEALIISEINSGQKELAGFLEAKRSYKALADAISFHKIAGDEFNKNIIQSKEKPYKYFGLEFNGKTDTSISDNFNAIEKYSEDLIFFSYFLCKALEIHAQQVSKDYKKDFCSTGPQKIIYMDETKLREENLIPDHKNYSNWLEQFNTQASMTC